VSLADEREECDMPSLEDEREECDVTKAECL
jgi:hypothetical protein